MGVVINRGGGIHFRADHTFRVFPPGKRGLSGLQRFDRSRSRQGRLVFMLLACLLTCLVYSQEQGIRFERITIEEGLSQNAGHAILQDNTGFMWFGTEDGLNRYDGYQFLIFPHISGDEGTLWDGYVNTMYQKPGLPDERIWIGTRFGLNSYDPITERMTRHQINHHGSVSRRHRNIVVIIGDNRSRFLWIGSDAGLDRFDPETGDFEHFDLPEAMLPNPEVMAINAIHQDAGGVLWICTADGLLRFDPGSGEIQRFHQLPSDNAGVTHDEIRAILPDGEGGFWLGTGHGLFRFDPSTGQRNLYPTAFRDRYSEMGLDGVAVNEIHRDRTGGLWLATFGAGLVRLNPENFELEVFRYTPSDLSSLSHDIVITIGEDITGTMWFGTVAGVNRYHPDTARFGLVRHKSSDPRGLINDMVRAFHKEGDTLWVGTDGGVCRKDRHGNGFTRFQHEPADPNSLCSNRVRGLASDGRGGVWIATRGGLDRYNAELDAIQHHRAEPERPDGLPTNDFMAILPASDGALWLAGWEYGLVHYDPVKNTSRSFRRELGNPRMLSDNKLICLLFDQIEGERVLWIGTWEGGVNRLDTLTGEITHYVHDPEQPQSISHNTVRSLYQDQAGILWVGTDGGLTRFDPIGGGVRKWHTRDGLPNNVIHGIVPDEKGHLWMSTNRGLTRFDTARETFRNFNVRDGLQGNEFNSGATFRDAEGKLYFGGIKGYNTFLPPDIEVGGYPLNVALTRVFRDNEKLLPRYADDGSPLVYDAGRGIALYLNYRHDMVAVEFAAFHFGAPHQVGYRYKLEGYDNEWHYTDATHRRAIYTNLPSGDFQLRIQAGDPDGSWSEREASLYIDVEPPPWLTWWAYTIYACLVLSLIYGFVRWRMHANSLKLRRQEKLNRILEKKVEERTRELREKNREILAAQRKLIEQEKMASLGTLTAGVAHEINTPIGNGMTAASFLSDRTGGVVENLHAGNLTRQNLERYLENTSETARFLLANMERAAELIRGFKQVAVDRVSDTRRRFDLKAYLEREVRSSVSGKLMDGNHTLTIDCPEGLEVDSYPGAISEVVYHLVDNAIAHGYPTGMGGHLQFSIRSDGEELTITYLDDGRGVPAENLKRIFDPFYTTGRGAGHVGLGLHVVYNLITQRLGGTIACDQGGDRGLCLKMVIPIVSPDYVKRPEPTAETASSLV